MPVFTVRDAKFFGFVSILAEQAKRLSKNAPVDAPVSINAEIGYGGARLMDVRWTGYRTLTKLCECIHNCSGENVTLRLVGSSAGNIVVYTLAMVLSVRGVCCGYDVKQPQKRGRILMKDSFFTATGLRIPDDADCACECVRRIADLLLEVVAVQEHPAWHNGDAGSVFFDQQFPGLKFNTPHELSARIIKDIFEGKETAETILAFGPGTAACGYSDLYIEAPFQYALNMYRAIDGLEGRVGALYILSRHVILFCTKWADVSGIKANPLLGKCEMYLGAKKITGDEGYEFTELVSMDLVPLVALLPPLRPRNSPNNFRHDVDIFNRGVDVLMDSIDVRHILFPHLANVIWNRKIKRMRLRNDKTLHQIENWRWSGRVSTSRSFSKRDFEIVYRQQVAADIMTNNDDDQPLQDFEDVILKNAPPGRTSQPPLCWNYVFEISPRGKHLFPLERIHGLFEASLPLITPWSIQKKKGREDGHLWTENK